MTRRRATANRAASSTRPTPADTTPRDPSAAHPEQAPEQGRRRTRDRSAGRTTTRGRTRARPLTDDDRAAILAALDEGLSRNATARRVGRSPDTVSRVADEAGHTFDRTATAAATAAAATDRKAQRVESSGRLLDALDATTERLIGDGRNLTPHEWASLARATVDLSNAHGRLADLAPETDGRDEALGLLGNLNAYLQAQASGTYEHPEDVHPLGPDPEVSP